MVAGQDIIIELDIQSKMLNTLIDKLLDFGLDRDKKESDYRLAMTQAILEQQADGQRATLIPDIVRGLPEVNKLRYARDVSVTLYDHCQEAINGCKLVIRVLESQISREWNKNDSI